jgi:hypothetical protein
VLSHDDLRQVADIAYEASHQLLLIPGYAALSLVEPVVFIPDFNRASLHVIKIHISIVANEDDVLVRKIRTF